MKIIKGILTYTLLLLGGAAILAVLLIGCMFMFPNFSVFGWKVMFYSNQTSANAFSDELVRGKEYTVEIDAKLHDVYIRQFSDDTNKINVVKVDDMFGLYNTEKLEKYNTNVSITQTAAGYKIETGVIEGAIIPRKSYINVYVPNGSAYNFVIRTTEGDIYIDGKTSAENVSALNVKGLDITTVNGDFSWSNVKTTIVKSVYDATNATAANSVVGSINTEETGYNKNNYMRFVYLNKLNATTKYGKFDFSLNYTDANNYIVTTMTSAKASIENWNSNFDFDNVDSNDTIISNLRKVAQEDTTASEYFLKATRGEFKFDNIVAKGLSVIGDDVLINAKNIITLKDFNFNAPNGFFEIESLNSKLSTIVTNNINVVLEKAQGELAITTTYGNINIKNATKNTTLKSTNGNITVDNATGNLSAISKHGDILVKQFSSKVYLKNTHGKITAAYNYDANAVSSSLNCEMINEEGSINAINIALPTTLKTTAGGTINAIFRKMELGDYKHVVELEGGGQANITIPNTDAFMYKGDGEINGAIGSVAMQKSTQMVDSDAEGYVTILEPNDASLQLAKLEVKATTGKVTFVTYDQTKNVKTAANSYEKDFGIDLAA